MDTHNTYIRNKKKDEKNTTEYAIFGQTVTSMKYVKAICKKHEIF